MLREPAFYTGIVLAALLFPAPLDAGISAIPTYTLTDLGMIDGADGSHAMALNDSGQVVGWVSIPGNNKGQGLGLQAFLYSGGVMRPIGDWAQLHAGGTDATGINNRGQVTLNAYGTAGGIRSALIYSGGSVRDLGAEPGSESYVNGINAAGQAVGFSHALNQDRAVLFNGGVQPLGTFGGTNSTATAINAGGEIVGGADLKVPEGTQRIEHAFLYASGQMRDLDGNPSSYSVANAINARGDVVGNRRDLLMIGSYFAFLYRDGRMRDLGTLEGGPTFAYGINDSGSVVGASGAHGFLYADGAMYDLNGLIRNGAGYAVFEATAINSSGQIAADATTPSGEIHAVLLTPGATAIPLPPAAPAALAALPLLVLYHRLGRNTAGTE